MQPKLKTPHRHDREHTVKQVRLSRPINSYLPTAKSNMGTDM